MHTSPEVSNNAGNFLSDRLRYFLLALIPIMSKIFEQIITYKI